MAKNQKLGKNSALAVTDAIRGALTDQVLPPKFINLDCEEELELWAQFTAVRSRKDWRDFDLILVAKAVKGEVEIREMQRSLKKSGVIIKNDRGTPIPNPLISIIDTYQRQQLAVLRSLSIMQMPSDPRTINAAGARQAKYKSTMDELGDLIAKPE